MVRALSGGQRLEERTTRLLTAAAGLSADPAVLHAHLRVPLTLLGTLATCLGAGLHKRACVARGELRLARQLSGSRLADIRAVQVEVDALDEVLEMFAFAKAGIGACGTRLRAVHRGLDRGRQPFVGD